tara:strand:+ start:1015 stop:1170 length:156 start_codon:yes stop_codon:yes gene_type:complete
MLNKHQNSSDDYIVIGGKRRWFETPTTSKDSPATQDAYREQTSSVKEGTID